MDLYYRLNVLRLDLPPLRERLDDLEKLSNYFVSILSARYGKNVYSVTPETLELFRGYTWPGNLRELRNIIERSLVNARSGSPLSVSGPLGDSELGVPLTAARGERAWTCAARRKSGSLRRSSVSTATRPRLRGTWGSPGELSTNG